MKAMFKLLAVVALIAMSNAFFLEFSEDAAELFSTADAEASANAAKVINADREFEFRLPANKAYEDDVFLYPDQLPNSARKGGHKICGNDLGIEIQGVGTFCNASFFHIKIDRFLDSFCNELLDQDAESEVQESGEKALSKATEDENACIEEDNYALRNFIERGLDEKILQFSIYFKSTATEPCLLEIPIFQIPSEVDSSDQKNLEKWAKENKVGLFSASDKVAAVRPKRGLKTDFKWLSDLLKYGIFKSEDEETGEDIPTYTSRPMVLSEKDLKHLNAWIGAVYFVHLYKEALKAD